MFDDDDDCTPTVHDDDPDMYNSLHTNGVGKQWYIKRAADQTYYSPFRSSAAKYIFPGPGDREATPAERQGALEHNPGMSIDAASGLLVDWDHEDTTDESVELPAGTYRYLPSTSSFPERLCPMDMRTDKSVRLSGPTEEAANDVKEFLANEPNYEGGLYRFGVLMYGPPGNGKTSAIRYLIKDVIPKDSIVIFISRVLPGGEFLAAVNKTLKSRLKVFVFEELSTMARSSQIDQVLDFLDGETSIDRSITIATTNYPENLPGNMADRPSRFDKIYGIGPPNAVERKILIQHFLNQEPSDQDVEVTKGMSIAYIQLACRQSKIRNQTLANVVVKLKKRTELVKREFKESKGIGFGFSEDEKD